MEIRVKKIFTAVRVKKIFTAVRVKKVFVCIRVYSCIFMFKKVFAFN